VLLSTENREESFFAVFLSRVLVCSARLVALSRMQRFLYRWWPRAGLGLAVLLAAGLAWSWGLWSPVERVLWASWIALLLHQAEEYLWPGTFPGVLNRVFFRSGRPDRYPLNQRSAFWVNVGVGWSSYGLAAVFGEAALWLGIATMTVSVGNAFFHCLVLNRRGGTLYHPGVATSLFLFLPLAALFVGLLVREGGATAADLLFGVPLGLVLNFVGIVGLLRILADPESRWVFPGRRVGGGAR
jgi:hypothetical protein